MNMVADPLQFGWSEVNHSRTTSLGREKSFLACQGVSFRRSEDQPFVLQDLQLEVKRGELICLLGPSGCGKTTLLNLLAGFLPTTAGEVVLDGSPVRGPSRDLGVVFQSDDALFGWLTAHENVGFGLRMRGVPKRTWKDAADHYLDLVGLVEHGHKFPHELSGGMRQRVQIARALANEPKVLLMDEPFAALDAQTRSMLQDELVRIWSETGKTIVFITHDIGEAVKLADRVGVMAAGPASRIKTLINVTADRPRSVESADYFNFVRTCHKLIEEEVQTSLASNARIRRDARTENLMSVEA